MLAIAELCGVGEKAREAAAALSRRNDEASLGVELLRDIRGVFEQRTVDRLRSEELTEQARRDGRPPVATSRLEVNDLTGSLRLLGEETMRQSLKETSVSFKRMHEQHLPRHSSGSEQLNSYLCQVL